MVRHYSPRKVRFIKRDKDGEDEIVLNVAGPNMGREGFSLGEGSMEGAYFAERSETSEVVASIPGSRPGKGRVGPRRIQWRVRCDPLPGRKLDEMDSLLFRVMRPGQPFIAQVESDGPDGLREITCYRTGTPKKSSPFSGGDARSVRWVEWTIDTISHDPWWYGEEYVDEWFNDGSGVGSLLTANFGDELAWSRFIIAEAAGDQTWTVPDGIGVYPDGHAREGQRIEYPVPTVPAGLHALVDTQPLRLPFTLPGRPMAFGLTRQRRFVNPLPAEVGIVEMPLKVVGPIGAGIRCKTRSVYERPWG